MQDNYTPPGFGRSNSVGGLPLACLLVSRGGSPRACSPSTTFLSANWAHRALTSPGRKLGPGCRGSRIADHVDLVPRQRGGGECKNNYYDYLNGGKTYWGV